MTAPDLSPYQGYVYAYPHKSAYRPLDPRPELPEVWAGEPTGALFLYLHIPFCDVRCGFCNLFTRTGASVDIVTDYLDALERQATAVRQAVPDARFAVAAVGGGTPTYLEPGQLARLADIAEKIMGADLRAIPLSVETSPATATRDRLAVLAERGATRVSVGVQSFVDTEARAVIRPQRRTEVEAALTRIRDTGFRTLNIDLIYGIDGQTPRSWRHSLDAALAWRPEELYLYPLYVRPLTGLSKRGRAWDDQRLSLYRVGRDHLLAAGYEQVSMRMFRLSGTGESDQPTAYRCQTDGMVGLGCGARSYTGDLHYSFEYAVGTRQVRSIIDGFNRLPQAEFAVANVGFRLDDEERRRRHVIQSLSQADGLSRADYRDRFGGDVLVDFPGEFAEFERRGWLDDRAGVLRLTEEGLAHSDAVGPAMFSAAVRTLMRSYERR